MRRSKTLRVVKLILQASRKMLYGGRFLQERVAEAVSLAARHSRAPHFARSLEWLLFTSLEFNADLVPSPSKGPPLAPGWSPQQPSPERRRRGDSAGPLLLAAASLIRRFPQV